MWSGFLTPPSSEEKNKVREWSANGPVPSAVGTDHNHGHGAWSKPMLPPPTGVYGPHELLPTPTGLCGPRAGPATSDVVSTRELEAKSRCQHLSMCLSSRHYRTFARTCILGLASRDNFSAICDFFTVAFLNIYRPRDSRRCRPWTCRAGVLRDRER